jgi:lysophospholipase L1-like esterase
MLHNLDNLWLSLLVAGCMVIVAGVWGDAAAGQPAASQPRPALPAPKHPLELRDGERVALIGGTFIERLQTYGYLETLLTAVLPDRHLVFRNLGWSGDTVLGDARAVFGGPNDGFQRLLNDLKQTEPTLLVVAYGANEAQAGEAGLEEFNKNLERLLSELAKIQPRIVLLSPQKRENLGPPLPDQKSYNLALEKYVAALSDAAKRRSLPYVNVMDLVPESGDGPVQGVSQLTDNGLHYSPYGHWRVAPLVAKQLNAAAPNWTVSTDSGAEKVEASGLAIKEITPTALGLRFVAVDASLPYPLPPDHSPEGALKFQPRRTLKITGMANAKYEVHVDDEVVLKTDGDELARGVELTTGPEFAQLADLQKAITQKNELFFNRYRPQNETYLFLFRKHEQGNNAVEIPQFDPLIEAKEREIAILRVPKQHVYKIVATESLE